MKRAIVFPVLFLILSGCTDAAKSIDYYSKHLDEAADVSDQCMKNIVHDETCANANEALNNAERLNTAMLY